MALDWKRIGLGVATGGITELGGLRTVMSPPVKQVAPAPQPQPSAYGAVGGMYPQFQGTGYSSVAPQAKGYVDQNQLNTQGLQALRGEALRAPGSESPWAKLQGQKLGQEQNQAYGDAARLANTSSQTAMSSLARSGGLTSGARERVARGAAEQGLMARQDVTNQGVNARLGVGIEDERNRLATLNALPGQEAQAVSARSQAYSPYLAALEGDRNAYMAGQKSQNDYNLGSYSELMKGYSSDQQAAAAKKASERTFWDYLGF